ncbi:MAG: hypothetical protein Q9159_005035 [Coniocarpon cinnabarinum]
MNAPLRVIECVARLSQQRCFRNVHPNRPILQESRYSRRPCFQTVQARALHTSEATRAPQARHREGEQVSRARDGKNTKRKPPRSPAANASLRKVAFEAERSRGRTREGENLTAHKLVARHDEDTKTVTAYCAAEQYSLESVAFVLGNAGYVLDPLQTKLYPQVVHFQMPSLAFAEGELDATADSSELLGDVFVFPSGTVVAWDVDEERVQQLISGALRYAAVNAHPNLVETEDLDYFEDGSVEKSAVVGDTIRLGTKPLPSILAAREGDIGSDVGRSNHASSHYGDEPNIDFYQLGSEQQQEHRQNLALAKIAFSSGLARSTKVAVLESLLDTYFANTQDIPRLLSKGSRLPFGRAFMLRKTGELLSVRAQLNLTELIDRLPDLFWDSRHELGLEGYFDYVGRALDVNVRIRTLNERMDYAQEIAAILRENLGQKHSLLLEWLIIGLISIEVAVEGWKIWTEWSARSDPHSTENLMHRWLEKELDTHGEPEL